MAFPSQTGPRQSSLTPHLILIIASLAPILAFADTWVVTDSNHPVQTRLGVRVILLDDTQRLQDKLSEGLPADPRQAMAIVRQRMQSQDGQRLQKDLAAAQQGLTDSWSLGIARIPAVIVDRQYVIYGETDVSKAEQRIARYRESQQ
ncbi:TIGR03757 family integrating conjugative element protein [Pseudomonas cichorii]|uniref:TIGR03757 family integrating conjugative element protein n=1 Tax=Pseudomonas cichorii TaxID=36746 RepID=UPI0018E5F12A|nr:TIGR03757 family integrating conjugative element protein [Pseudomonas cichorii]MBI6856089.1 TIGR03757 family integrating conjugative element protein [Pseudomonas cichorii]